MADRISKLQRWIDLIAYLAGRRLPVTVEQIMEAMPGYRARWRSGDDTARASLRRAFERDKKGLREAGIGIETVDFTVDGLETEGYLLRDRDFYLPYIRLVAEMEEAREAGGGGAAAGRAGGGESGGGGSGGGGSTARRASPDDAFHLETDELQAAAAGLRTLVELPAFPFERSARSALRKLTFDLVDDPTPDEPVLFVEPPGTGDLHAHVLALTDAVARRKRVTFGYHGIYRDRRTERRVRPYGLLFQHGHWYLVAHDEDREAIRVFRTGRMEAVEVNARRPGTADFEVPGDFELTDYAGRRAWELGEPEEERPVEAVVHFHFPRSLWAERNRYGTRVERMDDGSQRRSFLLFQTEPFVRWVMGQEGEAVIESPAELVHEFEAMKDRIRALYGGDGREGGGGPGGGDGEGGEDGNDRDDGDGGSGE